MPNEIVPFSLKDTSALIEHIWPTGKISAEAQKERKAVQSQTLTGLGSYWKGRKPLFLVRACVIASLIPITEQPDKDLEIFEKILGIHDSSFKFRVKKEEDWPSINKLPYLEKVSICSRVEEIDNKYLLGEWSAINKHLGTNASSIVELVEQLGVMRFGRRPRVADTFTGGGSIPFEAARIGCDVYASDLNPMACMLTWGAFNVVGSTSERLNDVNAYLKGIADKVGNEIDKMGIETNQNGDKAKAYLYCIETRCPETGWMVPLVPNWVISKSRNVIGKLVPNHSLKKYDIEIISNVSSDEMERAEIGTVVNGRLIHPMNKNELGISISEIRGDHKSSDGQRVNKLRKWELADFTPRADDIFQERLYCIQWIEKQSLNKSRQSTYFAAPTANDLDKEKHVIEIVAQNFPNWQQNGFLPNMKIEPGKNTSQPIWERGWTYWHQLFSPRQLLFCALVLKEIKEHNSPEGAIAFARLLDWSSKLCRFGTGAARESIAQTFYNQAINTFINYGVRSFHFAKNYLMNELNNYPIGTNAEIVNAPASEVDSLSDIYITDPPYADAVNYHEITEFFIAWLRQNPPSPFDQWEWDSRRLLAIQGDGKEFRSGMIAAYKAMADHMPDNGLQIVMFTHQSGKVWSDMAQIFWGAGLQVIADWYIATEASTELKKGGYVQGTHIIVLKKRQGDLSGYSDEITQEIKHEVAHQIETMTGLNQSLKGRGRMENLFEDADLQMAGYAAALRILTKYTKIDGKDMTAEALRPRDKKEITIVDELVEFSVQIANEHLVPEGMDAKTWERSTGIERFYLKMLDIESAGIQKLDNYQNFAKAFRVSDYTSLMADLKPNTAHLKNANDFSKRMMNEDDEFGSSLTRSILYALWEMSKETEDDTVLSYLRDIVPNYFEKREDLQIIANYIALKREKTSADEARNARILANLIKNERIG